MQCEGFLPLEGPWRVLLGFCRLNWIGKKGDCIKDDLKDDYQMIETKPHEEDKVRYINWVI